MYQINQKHSASQWAESTSAQSSDYLYELVKYEYKRNSRIDRFMNPSQSFSIEQSYINLGLVGTREHHEKEKLLRQTANNNVALERFEEIHGIKTRIEAENIFKACNTHERKVLVFGRAGIGKSTFCRHIV